MFPNRLKRKNKHRNYTFWVRPKHWDHSSLLYQYALLWHKRPGRFESHLFISSKQAKGPGQSTYSILFIWFHLSIWKGRCDCSSLKKIGLETSQIVCICTFSANSLFLSHPRGNIQPNVSSFKIPLQGKNNYEAISVHALLRTQKIEEKQNRTLENTRHQPNGGSKFRGKDGFPRYYCRETICYSENTDYSEQLSD